MKYSNKVDGDQQQQQRGDYRSHAAPHLKLSIEASLFFAASKFSFNSVVFEKVGGANIWMWRPSENNSRKSQFMKSISEMVTRTRIAIPRISRPSSSAVLCGPACMVNDLSSLHLKCLWLMTSFRGALLGGGAPCVNDVASKWAFYWNKWSRFFIVSVCLHRKLIGKVTSPWQRDT